VVNFQPDEYRPAGWLVLLDRVRQSYVDLDDPTYLEFPYIQRLADVIGAIPAGPLHVVHIGGGAATLARWIGATRPESTQLIFEPHQEMVRLVQAKLPFDPALELEFHHQDGRGGVAALPTALTDVLVVDAFSGGRVPADLTTTEFYAQASRVLRPAGLLLVNAADGAPHPYLRRLTAALAEHFEQILIYRNNDTAVSNVVIAAAAANRLPRQVHLQDDEYLGGQSRALFGAALVDFIQGALPLTDANSLRSPQPSDEAWRVGDA